MHVNFLEPDQDLQDKLNYAEVKFSQRGVNLVPVSGFKKRSLEFYYKRYINQEVWGLEAEDYLVYMSEAYQHLKIVLGDEEVWALDRVSVMSKPWRRHELKCVSVETLEVGLPGLRCEYLLVYYSE